jgi:hypothetical protein
MMELVKGIHSSSKVLLGYFHYGLKGQFPFQEDWRSKSGPKIAELSEREHEIVRIIAGEVRKRGTLHYLGGKNRLLTWLLGPIWRELHTTKEYETPGWFTGQLFVPDWKSQETIEEAPLAP